MQPAENKKKRDWAVRQGKSDSPFVIAALEDGVTKYVEDPFFPADEALGLLSGRPETAVVITVPCCNETLKSIMENCSALKKIIVADENPERLRLWRESGGKNFSCLEIAELPEDKIRARAALRKSLEKNLAELFLGKSSVYIPQRFKRLEPEFSEFLERSALDIQKELCSSAAFETTRSWHQTMNRIINLGCRNAYIIENPDEIKGQPVVIVGAGPSLNKNVGILKKYSDNALIIACDAALNILRENDIRPDFIVSPEDLIISWRFLAENRDFIRKLPLVCPLSVNHLIPANHEGPVVFTKGSKEPQWLKNFCEGLPGINIGLSVGHYAFHLAESLQASEIIMAGFDLALKNNEYHCEGMATPYFKDDPESFNLLEIEGIDGGKVTTELALYFHLQYFEEKIAESSVKAVDATEGGAKIGGTSIMSLEDALKDKKPVIKARLVLNEVYNREPVNEKMEKLRTGIEQLTALSESTLKDIQDKTAAKNMANPISNFPLHSDEYSLLTSCCSILLLSEFSDIISNFRQEDFSAFREKLEEVLKEFISAGTFLKELFVIKDYEIPGEGGILFLLPEKKQAGKYISENTAKRTIAEKNDSDLPGLWRTIREKGISEILCLNGEIIPDLWTVVGLGCTDIKEKRETQFYERSLWLPGYSVVCIGEDDGLFSYWQGFVPEDVECSKAEGLLEL